MRDYLKFTLITTLMIYSFMASSQTGTTQSIECLQVNLDGSVTITWTQFDNPDNNFDFYQISRREPGSTTYNFLTNVTAIANTSFTDNTGGINGNINSYCYQILIGFNDGSAALITHDLCTMALGTNSSNPAGFVEIVWNDPVPLNSTVPDGTIYEVYYEYPAGNWIFDGSFAYEPELTSYNHEVTVCSSFVNYRVDLVFPSSACSSMSALSGLMVEDTQAPEIPTISSVSVDSISGNALIDWFSVSAPDAGGYIVYQCINGATVPITTIFDPNLTEFINPGSNATNTTEGYYVASFDTCAVNFNPNVGLTSPTQGLCPSDFSTMLLVNQWQVCQEYVDLAWTEYDGWGNDGVAYYEVFRKNGTTEISMGIVDPEDNTFRDVTIDDNITYQYYIKAYSATINSSAISNLSEVIITAPPLPNNFSIFSATVTAEKENTVYVNTSPTSTLFDYVLLRKAENEPFSQQIQNTITDSDTFLEFKDLDVEPSTFSYQYQIGLVNQCNDTVQYSNVGTTILLDGLVNSEELTNTVRWSEYTEWPDGVDSYEIYRSIDGGALTYLTATSGNITFYEDDVSAFLTSKGEFCYQIVAKEANNPLGLNATSFSNELCLTQPPKIYIPSAFAVDGFNRIFKPVISFADLNTFQLNIYNRWGQEIYSTKLIEQGWDGTVRGNLIQEGTYMYYVEVKDGSGRLFEERGQLMMLVIGGN